VATVLRSRLVDRSATFVVREWHGRGATGVYRVRESGMQVFISHRTPDVHALDQAFYAHAHEPPPPVLEALHRLAHPLRALDVGANVGMWGLWLHGRFDVERVTGLEPDPDNVARHRRQIALNGLQDRWEVVQQAATVANGPVSFTVGAGANGHVSAVGARGAATVDGVDLFTLLDGVDLLKLDIEGGEWPILDDARFARIDVPVVMVEFHPDGAPSEPRLAAQKALEGASYVTTLSSDGPPGFGIWWGHRV
jgi:FkbM family methyltransferase